MGRITECFLISVCFLVAASACRKQQDDEPALPPSEIDEDEQPEPIDSHPGVLTALEPAAPVEREDADFDAGRSGDLMMVRVFADGFKSLDPKRRSLVYHLARAVLAGRDIVFDQLHHNGIELRQLIECVLKHSTGSDPDIEANLVKYLYQLWTHWGVYDRLSGRKLEAPFTYEQFEKVTKAANAVGADLGLVKGEPLEAKLSRLRKSMLDTGYQPVLANPEPGHGNDIIADSHLNLYHGVDTRDLKRFKGTHPRNSRLSRIGKKLVEEVYRTGDKRRKIPPGRYSQELRRVIRRLQDAMTAARKAQRRILVNLVEYFRVGGQAAFEEAASSWLGNTFQVEFAIGFTDTSIDPRGEKGVFSGWVGYQDRPNTSRVRSLARHLKHFEKAMPWEPEIRREDNGHPRVNGVRLVTSAGRLGPSLPFGLRLRAPDAPAWEKPAKVLVFTNVIEAYRRAVTSKVLAEFVPPDARTRLEAILDQVTFLRVAMAEVVGFLVGREDRFTPRQLRSAYRPIRALKAELVSFWLLPDAKLAELGLLPAGDEVYDAYRLFAAELVVSQALVRDGKLRPPRWIARRILARYLVEKAKVVTFAEKDERSYPVVEDPKAFREAIGKLLGRCGHILAEGDRRGALRLMQYAGPAEWPGLDEMQARARKAGLRRVVVYVMPKLTPHRDDTGRVVDVSVSHRESFERQMMRYRLY